MSSYIANILIAEDNQVSQDLMSGILRTHGYNTFGATDGGSAIDLLQEHDVDMALVDINMAPKGGFEFVKHLVVKGIDLPVVIVTGDDSSDMLREASALGVSHVIQKPIQPDRLIKTVERTLKRRGISSDRFSVQTHESKLSPESLMSKALDMAIKNAKMGKGGPFAAIVTDSEGRILGEGVNGRTSRLDPTAHAEVIAIRYTAEKLGKADLSECILYCSSEPTMMGQALIASVGIRQVYYALNHQEIAHIRSREEEKEVRQETVYTQLGREHALAIFESYKDS